MERRQRFEYLWEDFLSRPERVRIARTGGVVLGAALLIGLGLLLTRGRERPRHRRPERVEAAAAPAPSATVQDAFTFAKDLEGRLRSDARFSRVYLVPSAATANQKYSKVVIMGEVSSNDDLRALQGEIAKSGSPVAMEWQVAIAQQK